MPRKNHRSFSEGSRKKVIAFKQTQMRLFTCRYCYCPTENSDRDCGCRDEYDTLADINIALATFQEHPHWTDQIALDWSQDQK